MITPSQSKQSKASGRKTSHFGCLACKRAKVKCDEAKPNCTRCHGQRIQCEYSDKWRNGHKNDTKLLTQTTKTTTPSQREAQFELELMHYYCSYTCYTISTDGFEYLFQRKLPEIGFKFRYLIDAIFLLTAAHKNYIQPEQKYQDAIEKYKFSVITSLRDKLSNGVTRENGEAVFSASALLAIFSMICDTEKEFTGVSEQWMPLFQGSKQIYQQLEWWRQETCFADLHDYMLNNTLPDGRPFLHNFTAVLQMHADPNDHEVYMPVILKLARITQAIMSRTSSNILLHVISWIMRLPPQFVKLVDKFDPCALVIMANFFQSLSHEKHSWLFKNYAKLHQKRIAKRIPSEWHCYLLDTPTPVVSPGFPPGF